MNLSEALELAEKARILLLPSCERLEIAGDIRRKKRGNIDKIVLVAIPKLLDKNMLLASSDALSLRARQLISWGLLSNGDTPAGREPAPCGPRHFSLKYRESKLEIYSVHPREFGTALAMNTGDEAFTNWLCEEALKKGMKIASETELLRRRKDIYNMYEPVDTPEEEDFFRELGLPFFPPERRGSETNVM